MTTFDRQAVIECLSRLVTPGIKLTALADELGARKHEYAALRSLVFALVEEGVATLLPAARSPSYPRAGRAIAGRPSPSRSSTNTIRRTSPTCPPPRPRAARRHRRRLPSRPSAVAPCPGAARTVAVAHPRAAGRRLAAGHRHAADRRRVVGRPPRAAMRRPGPRRRHHPRRRPGRSPNTIRRPARSAPLASSRTRGRRPA